jgi:hypothetical protein
MRKVYKILVGKDLAAEGILMMNLKEIGWGEEWIYLAVDRV